jgi:hypothetical protein
LIDIGDEQAIYRELPEFMAAVRQHSHPVADLEVVRQFSRRGQTNALAKCLDQLMMETAKTDTVGNLMTGSEVSTDQPARGLSENRSESQGGI